VFVTYGLSCIYIFAVPTEFENVFYHLVQNFLSYSLLPKNLNINIYRIIILPVVYGCDTWSITLREEPRLKVLENGVLRGIFGPKKTR
jgi:hypothetical protein